MLKILCVSFSLSLTSCSIPLSFWEEEIEKVIEKVEENVVKKEEKITFDQKKEKEVQSNNCKEV